MNSYQIFKEEIEPRIELLQKEKKYIEAFFFLSAVLEQELTALIELYEKHSARLVARGIHKLNLKEYRETGRKNTLGELKKYLKIFTGDGALVKELDFFIQLRNDCVHNILKNSLHDLDRKISQNIDRYYKLLFWLLRRQNKLLKSEIRSYKRKK